MSPKTIAAMLAVLGGSVGAGIGAGIATTAALAPVAVSGTALPAAAAAEFHTFMAQAGGDCPVTCSLGVISNRPDDVYCTDGGTAGWMLSPRMRRAFESAVGDSWSVLTVDSGKLTVVE